MTEKRAPGSAHPADSEAVSPGPQVEDPVDKISTTQVTIAQLFAGVREREGRGFFGAQEAILAIFERLVLAADQHAPPNDSLPEKASTPVGGSPVTRLQGQATPTESSEPSHETKGPVTTTSTVDLSNFVETAANEIDRLCPGPASDSKAIDEFLTALWWTLFSAVRAIPYDHRGQDQLAAVVENLRSRARATVQVWGVSTAKPEVHTLGE